MYVLRVGALLTLFAVVVSCSSSTESGAQGAADVNGRVIQRNGAPWSGAIVGISCSDGSVSAKATADNAGVYGANLLVAASVLKASSGDIACRIGTPDSANGRVHVDRVIRFYPVGQPHPAVVVDLVEG